MSFQTPAGLVPVVDRVSFTLEERDILGLVGESGSGKSMSLLSIMGLIQDPHARISGSIRYRGRELLGLGAREWQAIRGREIAMIFQDPMTAMTPVLSIGSQIVEQIRTHQQLSRRAAKLRAVELLDAVGIARPTELYQRYPHQLSGGMRQRAVIAMALSCNPSILLADEPTTALDVTVQAQMLDLLRRLRADFGSAIVLVTHDLGVVGELADRVMVMYAGRIVEQAAAATLFAEPWHPYSWGLIASIPPLEGPRLRRLPAIPGAPPPLSERPAGCSFAPRCAVSEAVCSKPPVLAGVVDHACACWLAPADRLAQRARVMQLAGAAS